jgi:hypothetical protein
VARRLLAPLALGLAAVLGLFVPGPLGAALTYPALGFVPGAVLMRWLRLGRGRVTRTALALALAPLVTTIAAWGFVAAGLDLPAAARLVAVLAWIAWCAGRLRPAGGTEVDREPVLVPAIIALGFGGVIALIFFGNPVIQIRSDGWIHAGIVAEIMARGIPPQDPRYAGLTLNYVWFYNFFIALQSRTAGGEPGRRARAAAVAPGELPRQSIERGASPSLPVLSGVDERVADHVRAPFLRPSRGQIAPADSFRSRESRPGRAVRRPVREGGVAQRTVAPLPDA